MTVIRVGAKGSAAKRASIAQKATAKMPNPTRRDMVERLFHPMSPPRSKPKRRRNTAIMSVIAPPKSILRSLVLKSVPALDALVGRGRLRKRYTERAEATARGT